MGNDGKFAFYTFTQLTMQTREKRDRIEINDDDDDDDGSGDNDDTKVITLLPHYFHSTYIRVRIVIVITTIIAKCTRHLSPYVSIYFCQ